MTDTTKAAAEWFALTLTDERLFAHAEFFAYSVASFDERYASVPGAKPPELPRTSSEIMVDFACAVADRAEERLEELDAPIGGGGGPCETCGDPEGFNQNRAGFICETCHREEAGEPDVDDDFPIELEYPDETRADLAPDPYDY